jgi:hypothetical protein
VETAPIAELPGARRVPRSDPPNILWYFGAIVAAGAADVVVGDVSSAHRGVWIFLVGVVFMLVFAALCAGLLRAGWWVPGGTMAAAAVAVVPAAGVGFERLIGVWPTGQPSLNIDPFQKFQGAVFALVVATAVAGLIAFWLVGFPFVFLPVVVAVVVAVQLFLPVIVTQPSADDHVLTLIATGAALVVVGMLLDARRHRAAAFWWHAFGWAAIAVGLAYYTAIHHDTWAWVTVLILGGVVLLASAPLGRATWAVFGVAGVYGAALHYIADATGSWKSPLVLAAIGVGLVFLGIVLDVSGGSFVRRLSRPRYAP